MLGDVHVGSPVYMEAVYLKLIDTIKNDPYGYVVIVGDMMNNALKTSKSNVYLETLSPNKQKAYLERSLAPIASKILAGVGGNHENRSKRDVDIDPLFDVFSTLDIGDRYRSAGACLFISLGQNKTQDRGRYGKPLLYTGYVTHGDGGKNAQIRQASSIDSIDFYIAGHIHTGMQEENTKIVFNRQKKVVSFEPIRRIVIKPILGYEEYAIRKNYPPSIPFSYQTVKLFGDSHKVDYSEMRY